MKVILRVYFICQACRGKELDPGIHLAQRNTALSMRTEVDGTDGYELPTHADFLIAYSTPQGKIIYYFIYFS